MLLSCLRIVKTCFTLRQSLSLKSSPQIFLELIINFIVVISVIVYFLAQAIEHFELLPQGYVGRRR